MSESPRATATATKDLETVREQSQQPRARGETPTGFTGLLGYLSSGSSFVAPWWSKQRDLDLASFWKGSDKLSGAIALLTSKVLTVPVRVEPRDNSLKKHARDAEEYTIRLQEESEFGQGLNEALSKWVEDWLTSDNGAFFEIIGDGDKDGPIEGPALGVAHLDSHRCYRWSNPEYPVIYERPDGGRTKFHWTRVAYAADQPSAREEMLGVGFCGVSRSINAAQNLLDIATYKQEKLGSRPLRGILQGRGIRTDAILDALAISAEEMDNRGLEIFSQLAILGDIEPDAALELLSLVSLPDGFDEETSTRLGMFTIALAFGVPIRWIWPAAVSGATKADAMYQHIAGLGGGIGRMLETLTMLLGGDPRGTRHGRGKFLPEHLKLSFDFQDDEQDRMRAEIQAKRSKSIQVGLETGVYGTRVAREKALAAGDLTQAQFEELELGDGRLPDGTTVLSLFHNAKEPFLSWLDLGIPNPLMTTSNDPIDVLGEINAAAVNVQDVLANSGQAGTRKKAQQALAALSQLKAMYAPLAQQAVQADIMARFGAAAPMEGEGEAAETVPEVEVKALATKDVGMNFGGTGGGPGFDFTVGVGEIIGGMLARGEGGRFMNAAEMMEQIRAGMMDRLGKATSTGKVVNSAAGKRAANRAEVAEALGMDPATLDTLAAMKTGDASLEAERALIAQGLAQENADGTISMTSDGRSLLSAANSGDVDKAEQQRSEAQERAAEGAGGGSGGGGKKPQAQKPSPEEERRTNLAEVKGEIDEGRLPDTDFDNLVKFSEGQDLPEHQTRRLAQAGMVEIDTDGNARMTTAGKRFVRAAEDGDVREAKDQLSIAAEEVREALEKAREQRARAEEYEDKAREATAQAEAQASEMRSVASDADAQAALLEAEAREISQSVTEDMAPEAVEQVLARAQEKRDQAMQYREAAIQLREKAREALMAAEEQSAAYEERAAGYRTEAQELETSVGGGRARPPREPEPETDEEPGPEPVEPERPDVGPPAPPPEGGAEGGVDIDDETSEWLVERYGARVARQIEDFLKDHTLEDFEDWVTAAPTLGTALDRLRGQKALPLWERVRRYVDRALKQKLTPSGVVLPPVDEVEITEDDKDRAVQDWDDAAQDEDRGLPQGAMGLLSARRASPQEVAGALREVEGD